jgi:hypothetical protein
MSLSAVCLFEVRDESHYVQHILQSAFQKSAIHQVSELDRYAEHVLDTQTLV